MGATVTTDLTSWLLEQKRPSPVRSWKRNTPATAVTVPGRGPTGLESNMTERIASECGCVTTGKIVRGMCATHYDRWVHATPKDQRGPSPRENRRFWDHVDKKSSPTGCWIWTGAHNAAGYGLWRRRLAHRLVLRLELGELTDDQLALHRCDNPPCVNPDHLYAGDHRQNWQDAADRGLWHHPNSLKTHCKNGHPLDGANLIRVGTARRCRTCDNKRKAASARRARQRAGAA